MNSVMSEGESTAVTSLDSSSQSESDISPAVARRVQFLEVGQTSSPALSNSSLSTTELDKTTASMATANEQVNQPSTSMTKGKSLGDHIQISPMNKLKSFQNENHHLRPPGMIRTPSPKVRRMAGGKRIVDQPVYSVAGNMDGSSNDTNEDTPQNRRSITPLCQAPKVTVNAVNGRKKTTLKRLSTVLNVFRGPPGNSRRDERLFMMHIHLAQMMVGTSPQIGGDE